MADSLSLRIQDIIDRLRGTNYNPNLVHPDVLGSSGLSQKAAQDLQTRKAALDAQIAAAGG